MRAVSLFSNCGAGDVGFRNAGFTFEVMAELDPRRLEVCLLNHPGAFGVPGDLRETWGSVVTEWHLRHRMARPDLLAACPPCQGMSSARSGLGDGDDAERNTKEERNLLVEVIKDVALVLLPRLIVVENVPQFLTRKVLHPDTGEKISAANLLIQRLRTRYAAFPIIADLADYGVPQTRRRSFLVFIDRELEVLKQLASHKRLPYPVPTHEDSQVTVKEALQSLGLPSLTASPYFKTKHRSSGYGGLHFVPRWDRKRFEMVRAIPKDKGGSAWENSKTVNGTKSPSAGPDDAVCPTTGEELLRPVVLEDGQPRLIKGFRNSAYRRMRSDAPAATITTASGHVGASRTIHPWQNRLLSPYECMKLQTFPDDFKWGDALKKWGHSNVREMIGEAVPPHFTGLHGEVLKAILDGSIDFAALLPSTDVRHTRQMKKLEVAPTLFSTPS
ncbi:MAG: DNA cytosine methyltransferase [Bacteroidota bacterium]